MAILLARAVLPDVNGVAADQAVNDFVFNTTNSQATIAADVIKFYNHVYVSSVPVANYIGATRSRVANASRIDFYDIASYLSGAPHGSPVGSVAFTLAAASATDDLPLQSCVVVSYHGSYTGLVERGPTATRPTPEAAIDMGAPATHAAATRPRATARGRIYVGPLNRALLGSGPSGPELSVTMKGVIKAAASGLLSDEPGWSVWSRTTASVLPVIGGWVQDQFGEQRRRAVKTPTRSTTWP